MGSIGLDPAGGILAPQPGQLIALRNNLEPVGLPRLHLPPANLGDTLTYHLHRGLEVAGKVDRVWARMTQINDLAPKLRNAFTNPILDRDHFNFKAL